MKIHFLLTKDILGGGGIETYTREVGRRLVARGHEVTTYSTGWASGTPSTWEGMRIIWLPKARPYWAEKISGAALAAALALVTNRPDIIHLHSVAAGAMAAVLRVRRVPCVVQMHGIEWARTRWGGPARMVLKGLERCTLAYGDAFTAVSKAQCDYFAGNYGTHCEFIPTAAEIKPPVPPELIAKLGLQPCQYVLFAARLVPEKGAHYLIRAFRTLATEVRLVMAGECPSREYGEELRRLAAGDPRITFLGNVRGRLLEELFSSARVFVLPSELEGMSIGLIEAMSYGLPCIASDIPENLEVVGDAGLPFHNKNHEDLARALSWAIRNREAASEVGVRARQRVEAMFSWDRVVDGLEGLYGRVAWTPRKNGVPRYASPPA